jgi:ATP-binding cassette, subfamily B, heavy metal transporter
MKREMRDISFKKNFKIYLEFLSKYKWIAIFILFLVLIQESKFLLDKYLFKIIIDKGSEFSAQTLTADAFLNSLMTIGIVFVSASVFLLFVNYIREHLFVRMEVKMIYDLKQKFFNHILNLDHNFHTSHKTGSLISRLLRGGSAIERLTDVLIFNFVSLFFQLIVVTISLTYFNFVYAAIIFFTLTIFVAFSFYVQKLQNPWNIKANEKEDIEKGNVSDIFTNIDSIKYYGKENYISKMYERVSTETKNAFTRYWDYYKIMGVGQSFILALGTFLIVYFPLMDFLAGNITLGTLTFVYTIYVGLIGHMFGFVHGIRGFYRAMADFEDLFQYTNFENEIKDKKRAKNLEIKKGAIEFKSVSFGYTKRRVIEDVSLKIKPGEKVALVGHSGSGKTTLVKLLYRFFDVNKGEILIDGENIKNFKQESLRGELSVVPQEAVLFDDTIYNNIAFSRPSATKKEVEDAIKFAQLDEFIKNLPEKEKTIVGERGVKLSGGEKQRVSIARAILANKKVLVLDEATSALDSMTEWEIQKDLNKLMKGRTSLIIAHRLSTIMSADKIVVMDKGKIAQVGKHRDLINKRGIYNELWHLQKDGYIEE